MPNNPLNSPGSQQTQMNQVLRDIANSLRGIQQVLANISGTLQRMEIKR